MRVPTLFLLFFLAVLGAPSDSWAEKVKTNQSTKLLNRPGERGTVIMTIKEGQGMTVLAKEGRWLKVRVAGRTGYVPRSKVDVSDEIARNTRRRSFVDGRGTKRGFNGEEGPEDRVGADAVNPSRGGDPDEGEDTKGGSKGGSKGGAKGGSKGGDPDEGEGEGEEDPDEGEGPKGGSKGGAKGGDKGGAKGGSKGGAKGGDKGGDEGDSVTVEEDERPTARVKAKTVALQDPEEEAEESFPATPSTILYPTGTKKGKYTEVENDEGELGYVLTSQLEVKGGGGGGGGVSRGGEAGEGGRERQIDVRARLGVSIFSQKLRTAGAPVQVPDNYDLSTSAATLSLGGALLYPYKEKFVVGGELSYDFAKAIPGIKVMGGTTGVTLHNLKLRALGGYDLKKRNGLTVFGRLGLHYQSYQISDVTNLMKNTAKLPSEIVTAPSLGAGVAIPRLTPKIGLQFSLDGVFLASVSQTKNLEDGGSPSAVGAVIGAGMRYHWKKDMDITASYDLTLMSMSYGTPLAKSQRMHTGMGAVSRGDTFHAVTAGVSKAF